MGKTDINIAHACESGIEMQGEKRQPAIKINSEHFFLTSQTDT